MRHFLPIKGPGGRALTTKEKTALVVLSVTMILFVLTLLAGDRAFGSEPARNPVFGMVAALAQPVGMGIIAFYAVVLLWSGLIFFKGERAVRISPIPGRLLAALGITVGISGLLGIAQLAPAGDLGATVGGAVGSTFGAAFGFPILLAMMILGAHLAGQGAWAAFRGASAGAAAVSAPAPTSSGFTLPEQSTRIGGATMLPDDGDPSADERSLAVTRAMEEIERSKGVTIVEVSEDRTSIGEEVEATPAPEQDSQEAEVQRGLDAIAAALAARKAEAAERAAELATREAESGAEIAGSTDDSGWYHPTSMLVQSSHKHAEEAVEEEAETTAESDGEADSEWVEYPDDAPEAELAEEELEEEDEAEEEEEELAEAEDDSEADDEELEEEEDSAEAEEEEEAEDEEDLEDDEEEEEDDLDDEDEDEEYEDDDDDYEDEDEEDDEPATIVQPYLFPVASREIDEESEDDDADGNSAAANFDWRGRPVE